ncbi:MAG: hypothetical protein ACFFAU_03055 [Candidatus Hodarchaeota archaeon]
MDHPSNMPEGGYLISELIIDNDQFMDGCSIAGKVKSFQIIFQLYQLTGITWYLSLIST